MEGVREDNILLKQIWRGWGRTIFSKTDMEGRGEDNIFLKQIWGGGGGQY